MPKKELQSPYGKERARNSTPSVLPAEQGHFDRRHEQGDGGMRCDGSMIGLDSDVLVRFITQDGAKPSAKANTLIKSLSADKPEFISLIAILTR
jgi:hypothetical protein